MKTLFLKLNDQNLHTQSGAALGLVSVVEGRGNNTFHRFRFLEEMTSRLGSKALSNEKIGAILLVSFKKNYNNNFFKKRPEDFLKTKILSLSPLC